MQTHQWRMQRKIGKTEDLFLSLYHLMKNNPSLDVETAADMLDFTNEELEEYKSRSYSENEQRQ